MAECPKCEDMMVTNTPSVTHCKSCKKEIRTRYSPGMKICPKCSLIHNLCEQCGKKLKK